MLLHKVWGLRICSQATTEEIITKVIIFLVIGSFYRLEKAVVKGRSEWNVSGIIADRNDL